MSKRLSSMSVVLPRYGASIGGGAETLVRELLLHLKKPNDVLEVGEIEVCTTCAKDHRTWANEYAPGVTEEDGIIVRRFPVSERDLEVFIDAEQGIHGGMPLSLQQQLDWLANSVNSRELYSYLESEGDRFDVILFAPYLFATSFWGSLIHPERSILLPCLHDEAYAYQEVFQSLFTKVRGLIFNAEAEKKLASDIFGIAPDSSRTAVVGMGFDDVKPLVKAASRHRLSKKFPELGERFLLYSGRKEQGKNLDLLIDYFSDVREHLAEKLAFAPQLVLIGSGEIDFLDALPQGVIDLGFVSEDEKFDLLNCADCLCQPSTNESFSIVIMEAWQQMTPVLVHADCAVTREHVCNSGGGLYFSDVYEFEKTLEWLLGRAELAAALGKAGGRYIREEYSWSEVSKRFANALTSFGFFEPLEAEESAGRKVLG